MSPKGILLRVAFALVVILVAGTFLFKSNLERSNALYRKQIENDFKNKYKQLETQLQESERRRLMLADSFTTRNLYIQTLLVKNEQYEKDLLEIKGRYKRLNSSEKAVELTKRAHGE